MAIITGRRVSINQNRKKRKILHIWSKLAQFCEKSYFNKNGLGRNKFKTVNLEIYFDVKDAK